MKLVKPTSWVDGRGVTHYAKWGAGEQGNQYGWRLVCNGRIIFPSFEQRKLGNDAPTCIACVLEEL